MTITVELNNRSFALQLCEYLNMLAMKEKVAGDFICRQIDDVTLKICAINDSIKKVNINQAIKDLANAEEVFA